MGTSQFPFLLMGTLAFIPVHATNDFGMDTTTVDVVQAGTQLYKQMLIFD